MFVEAHTLLFAVSGALIHLHHVMEACSEYCCSCPELHLPMQLRLMYLKSWCLAPGSTCIISMLFYISVFLLSSYTNGAAGCHALIAACAQQCLSSHGCENGSTGVK